MKVMTFLGLLPALIGVTASAQAPFPSKPIQLIVSAAPGAGTDLMARTLSDRLGQRLGTPVIVDNRPAAVGRVAAQGLRKAAPDGYTLMFTNDNLVLSLALGTALDVNVITDFQHIVLTATSDFFLVVSGDLLKATNAQEFVQIAKAAPGKISYASPGVGAPHHLGMELFKLQTGTDIFHVPYKGMGPAVPDLLAGRVQAAITGFPAVASQMKSGKLRLLGVASATRSPENPEVPTFREQGIPNVEIQGYNYLVAPLGIAPAIVARLNREINEILKQPEVQAELSKRGTTALGGTPEQLTQRLKAEAEKWTRVVKTIGIKPEQ